MVAALLVAHATVMAQDTNRYDRTAFRLILKRTYNEYPILHIVHKAGLVGEKRLHEVTDALSHFKYVKRFADRVKILQPFIPGGALEKGVAIASFLLPRGDSIGRSLRQSYKQNDHAMNETIDAMYDALKNDDAVVKEAYSYTRHIDRRLPPLAVIRQSNGLDGYLPKTAKVLKLDKMSNENKEALATGQLDKTAYLEAVGMSEEEYDETIKGYFDFPEVGFPKADPEASVTEREKEVQLVEFSHALDGAEGHVEGLALAVGLVDPAQAGAVRKLGHGVIRLWTKGLGQIGITGIPSLSAVGDIAAGIQLLASLGAGGVTDEAVVLDVLYEMRARQEVLIDKVSDIANTTEGLKDELNWLLHTIKAYRELEKAELTDIRRKLDAVLRHGHEREQRLWALARALHVTDFVMNDAMSRRNYFRTRYRDSDEHGIFECIRGKGCDERAKAFNTETKELLGGVFNLVEGVTGTDAMTGLIRSPGPRH